MADLGKRIRKLRTEAGLTQSDLAEKLEIKKSTVSAYENGDRKPNKDTVIKIAYLFNVTTDWLLGLDERSEVIDLTGFSDRDIRIIRQFIASIVGKRGE